MGQYISCIKSLSLSPIDVMIPWSSYTVSDYQQNWLGTCYLLSPHVRVKPPPADNSKQNYIDIEINKIKIIFVCKYKIKI